MLDRLGWPHGVLRALSSDPRGVPHPVGLLEPLGLGPIVPSTALQLPVAVCVVGVAAHQRRLSTRHGSGAPRIDSPLERPMLVLPILDPPDVVPVK